MTGQVSERRRGERRQGQRRKEERRRRAIPVVVNLRSQTNRRQIQDRRSGLDRRVDLAWRATVTPEYERCSVLLIGGQRCSHRAIVRGSGDSGWICLEHLVSSGGVEIN